MRGRTAVASPAAAPAVLALALGLGLASGTAAGSPTIDVRVSVKVIRHPVTGAWPPMNAAETIPLTSDSINAKVARANAMLAPYGRGYRFSVVEIQPIGQPCAPCDSTNPSFWYGKFMRDLNYMERFEAVAQMYPGVYDWHSSAVNVYFNQGMGDGGEASFPDAAGSDEIVFFGGRVFDIGSAVEWGGGIFAHELGHYFELRHTQANDCKNCPSSCSGTTTDGDGFDDTLPDNPCMTRDGLSIARYGVPYNSLNTQAKKDSVDDVHANNMAYIHADQQFGQTFLNRTTEQQLDHWADTARRHRSARVSGTTYFVDGTNLSSPFTGYSGDPYRTVFEGNNAASAAGGDILVIRPGAYPENLYLNKPVTLRATRRGPATIGN